MRPFSLPISAAGRKKTSAKETRRSDQRWEENLNAQFRKLNEDSVSRRR